MSIPDGSIGYIQDMKFQDIISLCKTNKKFSIICSDPRVWEYLLKRDFDVIDFQGDQRQEYFRLTKDPFIDNKLYDISIIKKYFNHINIYDENLLKIKDYLGSEINEFCFKYLDKLPKKEDEIWIVYKDNYYLSKNLYLAKVSINQLPKKNMWLSTITSNFYPSKLIISKIYNNPNNMKLFIKIT